MHQLVSAVLEDPGTDGVCCRFPVLLAPLEGPSLMWNVMGGLMGMERPCIGKLSGFVGQKPGVKGNQVSGNRCWAAAKDVERVICGHHSLQALHK